MTRQHMKTVSCIKPEKYESNEKKRIKRRFKPFQTNNYEDEDEKKLTVEEIFAGL